MITKEEFLYNTKDDEVFCLIHEALSRLNELYAEEDKKPITILDKDIKVISEQMITNIKSQVWL